MVRGCGFGEPEGYGGAVAGAGVGGCAVYSVGAVSAGYGLSGGIDGGGGWVCDFLGGGESVI